MTKELTVAEISEALGYEVKVVKEQPKPKPYQFKAGDVADYDGDFRIFVKVNGNILSIDVDDGERCLIGQKEFEKYGSYKKIGELSDYIK